MFGGRGVSGRCRAGSLAPTYEYVRNLQLNPQTEEGGGTPAFFGPSLECTPPEIEATLRIHFFLQTLRGQICPGGQANYTVAHIPTYRDPAVHFRRYVTRLQPGMQHQKTAKTSVFVGT